jgi:sodium-dependent dicarboxylate transporter 2/3/5
MNRMRKFLSGTHWWGAPMLALVFGWGAATSAQKMAAIMIWVVGWWITQPVPLAVTGLIGIVLANLVGVIDAATAFSGFSHKVTLLLLGTFVAAEAMRVHGVDRAVSEWVLSHRAIRHSARRSAVALALLAAVMSCWLSSTATLTLLAPIAASMFSGPFAGRVLIAMAFAAPLGGISFPLGANPNILAIAQIEQQFGYRVSFAEWMAVGIPISLSAIALSLFWVFRKTSLEMTARRERFTGFTAPQIGVLWGFGLLMALWVLPLGLNEAVASLLIAVVFLAVPIPQRWLNPENRRLAQMQPLLSWKEAEKLDWSVLILVATGISLGTAIFKSGLADQFGHWAVGMFGGGAGGGGFMGEAWVMVFLLAATFLVTLVTSNTATGELMIPLAIGLSKTLGLTEATVPLVMGVAMIASLGVTLPAATPPVAVVAAYPSVGRRDVTRLGLLTDVGAFVVVVTGLLFKLLL